MPLNRVSFYYLRCIVKKISERVLYWIYYKVNVYCCVISVTSSTIDVRGMDQNITLSEDVSVLTLSFTTSCMNPKPDVKLYYTQEVCIMNSGEDPCKLL
jgi:hypothetical protein